MISPFRQVIEELVADTQGGLLGSAGGRFFGWVIGGSLPAALAADWLTAAWDQNAALAACSPAEAIIEEVCGTWLKELLGLPPGASFALVSGCQMAHVTCLAAARHALLRQRGWDCERDGLSGAPRMRVLSSSERHGSLERAVRLLGFGTSAVVELPADADGRLQPATLRQALDSQPACPTIVVLQAGDLQMGAYDPFADLIPLAHHSSAWVHIDGAFGLWAHASPTYRHHLVGVEQADSWATDGHKWLNVPFNWNPEWSRRGRGVATYAALRQLGKRGVADLIERCCRHARSLVTQIGALPGAELVWEPRVNQGLVRFLDPNPSATLADHDRWTDAVIRAVIETGEAFFSGTTWRGQRCMRVSVCNWQTNEADVARAVAATEQALKQR
jgi:glutamate/tyrosine decarboxylase-like PLP-dependent enzyme